MYMYMYIYICVERWEDIGLEARQGRVAAAAAAAAAAATSTSGSLGIIKGLGVKGYSVISIWDLNMAKFQTAITRHHWP